MFFGKNDAKAETPVLWPPPAKGWLTEKDSDAGRDWGQEEKGMVEDEMAGWHHRLDGHRFGWTSGVGDGHGDLVCCNSWSHKELDMTERLNWCTGHNGNPLQYSCLENPMDRGSWCRLLSMGSQRVRHDWVTSLSFTYALDIGAPQYITQTLTDIKGEINSNKIIVGDFNTPLPPMDISSKQKINKEHQS